MAFDDNPQTKWVVLEGHLPTVQKWLQIRFPFPLAVNGYTLSSANDFQARDPKDWTVTGDGMLLDTQAGVRFSSRLEKKYFSLAPSSRYTTSVFLLREEFCMY